MEFWATVLVPFLFHQSPTSFGVLSERSRRCRESMGFEGHAESFHEWLFAVEEAIRILNNQKTRRGTHHLSWREMLGSG